MRPELWPEVESAFAAALETPEAERRAWLERACSNPEVRAEVEALLAAHGRAEGFLSGGAPGAPFVPGRLLGRRLGPYEVVALIGSGGMGEVYRGRDPRIGRAVAIKVLPAPFAADAARMRRFLLEARAAGSLNHPNVMAVYDIGEHEGVPYLVCELLEGETFRARMNRGVIATAKTIEYALAISHGLAAAHAKGIVHRDLKPENIFLTGSGAVKILDFGLARLTEPEARTGKEGTETATGMVLGTAGYMSPEQVRGEPCDHRSDIFSFGAILYEMLNGQRAFSGGTSAETMTAVLNDEPPEPDAPPLLGRIVRRCLEKNPSARFQSTSDLAFALESLGNDAGVSSPSPPVRPARTRPIAAAISAFVLLALIAAAYWAGVSGTRISPPTFHQLTFRRGSIFSARFAPDGRTVIYGAKWGGAPLEVFMTRPESPESRPLGFSNTEILAVSPAGEMALSRGRHYVFSQGDVGTLARVPLAGGAPRDILDNVQQADWSPDGSSLAVIVFEHNQGRLEFPPGTVLYRGNTWLTDARVSPSGKLVAFIEHPLIGDDSGSVLVVDLRGVARTISAGWACIGGLAWSPNGDEIWFTAARTGNNRAVYGVSQTGKERLIARVAGAMILHDISPDGRLLVTRDHPRTEVAALAPGESLERDITWLDNTKISDITPDGSAVLFDETGEGGGARHSVYFRKLDGSPPVRLGDGAAVALSSDAKWALTMQDESTLALLPTGTGSPRSLTRGSVHYQKAGWFLNDGRIAVLGNEKGHGLRLFTREVAGGDPVSITPEGISSQRVAPSPDGRWVLARGSDGNWKRFPIGPGRAADVPGLIQGEPVQWANAHEIFVFEPGSPPAKIVRFNLETHQRSPWRELAPVDSAGVFAINQLVIAPSGKAYAYSYRRVLSNLYIVDGLK